MVLPRAERRLHLRPPLMRTGPRRSRLRRSPSSVATASSDGPGSYAESIARSSTASRSRNRSSTSARSASGSSPLRRARPDASLLRARTSDPAQHRSSCACRTRRRISHTPSMLHSDCDLQETSSRFRSRSVCALRRSAFIPIDRKRAMAFSRVIPEQREEDQDPGPARVARHVRRPAARR